MSFSKVGSFLITGESRWRGSRLSESERRYRHFYSTSSSDLISESTQVRFFGRQEDFLRRKKEGFKRSMI
jgi:hypothetical protein